MAKDIQAKDMQGLGLAGGKGAALGAHARGR